MKVILLKDVAKIGRRFEIVEVPDGYALNKLIPKNMAQFATPENIKRITAVSSKQKEHQVHDNEQFTQLLSLLESAMVTVEVEANAEGRMFQALKAEAIVAAIAVAVGTTISKDQVIMKEPIKSIGEHVIELASGKTHRSISIVLKTKQK